MGQRASLFESQVPDGDIPRDHHNPKGPKTHFFTMILLTNKMDDILEHSNVKNPPIVLLGGIPTPLKNMSSSVGMMTFPIYGK